MVDLVWHTLLHSTVGFDVYDVADAVVFHVSVYPVVSLSRSFIPTSIPGRHTLKA